MLHGGWAKENQMKPWFLLTSVPPRLLMLNFLQLSLASGEYMYALSLRSIALRAHALLVASEGLQTVSKVVAVLVRDKHADGRFSYGYGRCPVLIEYAGAAILVFVTCSLSLEAVLRLRHHSALFHGRAHPSAQATIITHDVSLPFLLFAVLHTALVYFVASLAQSPHGGLVNNLPTGALHSQHSTHYRDSLIRGCGDVFGVRARVFSFFGFSRQNMLFSISVLASMSLATGGLLMHWSGAVVVDAASCAVLCVIVMPLLLSMLLLSAPMLVQRAPRGPRAAFDKSSREVCTLEGVLECRNEHFWEHSPGIFVGTVSVRVRQTVETNEMLARVRARFAGVCTDLTVQIEKEESDLAVKQMSHQMQLLRSPAHVRSEFARSPAAGACGPLKLPLP